MFAGLHGARTTAILGTQTLTSYIDHPFQVIYGYFPWLEGIMATKIIRVIIPSNEGISYPQEILWIPSDGGSDSVLLPALLAAA